MNLERFHPFDSKHVRPHNVDVWLPPEYGINSKVRYPVIYMHDGQNLFFPEESFIGVDWGIDQAVRGLIAREEIPPLVIVGIWNTANRLGEYMPEGAFPTQAERDELQNQIQALHPEEEFQLEGEAYLKFIVEELKPWIDSRYPTMTSQPYTSLIGSSMGGLISLDAICCYPEVFFGAGCLSPAWNLGSKFLLPYFENTLPSPATHRIYIDMGGKEYSDDQRNESLQSWQATFNQTARNAGYQDNQNLLSLFFPNHEHSERYWRSRVDIPIQFLLENVKNIHE